MIRNLFAVLFFIISASHGVAQKKSTSDLSQKIKQFDQYVEASRNSWSVPGLSIAVVKDNQIIFKKGYGVRELGTNTKVDTQTLFACASTTKAMTAMCMGILVDEGKVDWNDPVIKHLPDFRVFDSYVTRDLKIRDLFIHNTGVGNTDYLWTMRNITSDEILQKMELVKPSYSLRSGYTYQNIFYLAAGKVIEKISGKPWDKFIAERIFSPLGMNRTFPLLKDINDANQTKPHYFFNESIHVIENTSADVIGPAGSVWSCADDMAKWMLCMLDSSKYAGGRLLKAATWTEMFKPQTIIPMEQFYPTARFTKPNWVTYGLAWFQHDYKGMKVNFHTGSLAGAIAIHGQLPAAKLGVYVFGNYDHAEVRHALMYKAFDVFALGGNHDWNADFLKMYTDFDSESKQNTIEFESKRALNTQPSLKMADYAGTYSDPLFGIVEISQKEQQLIISINEIVTAKVDHWHFDTFRGVYDKEWYGKLNVVFKLNASGEIENVVVGRMTFSKNK